MSTEEKQENIETPEEVLEVTEEENIDTSKVEAVSEYEQSQNALNDMNDKYARVHADFENVKKRLEREKYQALEYANEKFAKDLIPVLDALTMALKAGEAEAPAEELLASLKEGMELTMKQLLTALEKHGITEVSEDEPFDPNLHNAVQQMDSEEHESGQIVQTFQKAYKYKDRTLREGMVVIAN
ncbi:MAG: nucleotide exchange factor GrpE [Helicobacteraceae bacterium]|nr:nucleotide exchange factor GrpE [Helicobacteraceae bacterium]